MNCRTFASANEAYHAVYEDVLNDGARFSHREGRSCLELRPYVFTLADPHIGLYTGVTRRMNYRFWAAETLGYIAGWGSIYRAKEYADLLVRLNSNYANFRDPYTEALHKMVCYGDSFGPGLLRAYETLKAGPNRRQAIVYIGSPETRHTYEDNPCLATAHYYMEHRAAPVKVAPTWDTEDISPIEDMQAVRRGDYVVKPVLSALYHIRSNDLNWGFPYDVAAFCAIQLALASALGVAPGAYHHMATSMHFYESGPMGEGPPNIAPYEEEVWAALPPAMPAADHQCSMHGAQALAGILLDAMHGHFVVNNGRGAGFQLPKWEDNEWARQWCDVVRWGWPSKKSMHESPVGGPAYY